ncbi:MAG: 50S ribosomal protein L18 [Chloroflexi bacterium]|nr:50S ribosomal protein L18 [Chloroflexota bacterium]|tara:strand:- start:330 stop:695 length:366 start_codon:yes stop_codon:yes gene_type:complete
MSTLNSKVRRVIRHGRIRKKVIGTTHRPRLAIYRSLNNIYAQLIDDSKGHTLVSASTLDKDIPADGNVSGKMEISKRVGQLIAQRAKNEGITQVVFDRGGYKYHGRVKALADAVREEGLKF